MGSYSMIRDESAYTAFKDLQNSESERWWRPVVHFSPQTGWMNDPCGLIYHDDRYHLFYQHNPNETAWGPMHWGHASSADLVTWTDHPIALFPDNHYGMAFTGSVIVDGSGMLNAFYTGALPDRSLHAGIQQQVRATSHDGFRWEIDRVVLPNPGQSDFRDPKVGKVPGSDRWFLVLGVGREVRIYSSADLVRWRRESILDLRQFGVDGVVECPDLFPVPIEGEESEMWVLTFSVLGARDPGTAATYYLAGDFDGRVFQPHTTVAERIDHGSDFYALQTWAGLPAGPGRAIGVAYASNWAYAHETPAGRWRGILTIPREFTLARYGAGEYRLRQRPVAELDGRLGQPIAPTRLGDQERAAFRIDGTVSAGVTVNLVFGAAGNITVSLTARSVQIDRRTVDMGGFDVGNDPIVATPSKMAPDDRLSVDFTIIVDRSILEVFLNGGEMVATTLMFPRGTLTDISVDDESESGNGRWCVRSILLLPEVFTGASEREKEV
jgi:fructan beta-fructosidase